ncbi:MAG: T9SS type A sorting domain-containing protein [Chitinophagales bacterium]|nr:T9SS type A sorting domain-containing protein [Chitinophagales bacterium]
MKSILKASIVTGLFLMISQLSFGQCQAAITYVVADTTALGVIEVIFFDQSVVPDSFKNWTLDYGDGVVNSLQEPPSQGLQYKYDTAGIYVATLVIGTDSCSDTTMIEVNACFTPVWPGDANADKIANNLDILPIGLNFGVSTPPRVFPSADWLPFCALSDTGGLNILSYSDCDGNGIIDSADVGPIVGNYGLTHKKTNASSPCVDTAAPELFFVLPSTFLEAGDIVEVEIHLGTSANPAVNAYGVVFSIDYDKNLVDSVAGVTLDFSNSELLDSSSSGISISHNFYSMGRVEGGVTRTDGFGKNVSGRIGSMLFVLEDDLIQKTWDMNDSIVERTFPLSFSDITFIDPSGFTDTICAKSDSATVTFVIPGIDPGIGNPLVKIYPNPTSDHLTIQLSNESALEELVLSDYLGREILRVSDPEKTETIVVEDLQAGSCFLKVIGKDFEFSEKIIIF